MVDNTSVLYYAKYTGKQIKKSDLKNVGNKAFLSRKDKVVYVPINSYQLNQTTHVVTLIPLGNMFSYVAFRMQSPAAITRASRKESLIESKR